MNDWPIAAFLIAVVLAIAGHPLVDRWFDLEEARMEHCEATDD